MKEHNHENRSAKFQIPTSNIPRSSKSQTTGPAFEFRWEDDAPLELQVWSFFGAWCLVPGAWCLVLASGFAQGTAFTYQGRLNDGANPATGSYDLSFAMFDALTSGAQQGSLITNTATAVSNGLFTVTLDFGNQFPGANRWLEIAMRTNGAASFLALSPRQALTRAPYAITAGNLSGVVPGAGVAGTYPNPVTFTNAANSFSGNGSGLANVNALTLGGIGSAGFWQTSGNAGTTAGPNFLGTADNQPLIVKVNGQEAFRFEPTTDTPNVVGGYSGNYVQPGVPGVTIGGGGTFLYGDQPNVVTNNGNYATIAGGYHNTVTNYGGAILGGSVNFAGGYFATIGGGQLQTALGDYSIIGGGYNNMIQTNAVTSAIAGGHDNLIQSASYSIIGGGGYNIIQPDAYDSAIGGGGYNTIQTNAHSSFIGGGGVNTIQTNSPYSTIGGGYFNTIQNYSYYATIGGGQNNVIGSGWAVIAGGYYNANNGLVAFIGSGDYNSVGVGGSYSFLGGGLYNTISGYTAVIPGGYSNSASGFSAFAAGHRARALHDGTFVWADDNEADFSSSSPNQFLIRAGGGVGINKTNPAVALDVNGTVSASAFVGSGSNLSGLDASQLTGTIPSAVLTNAWKTTGNAGTSPGANFIGTTDNQPLEIRVNNARALRLEPNATSPNLVGGFSGNVVSNGFVGATIADGGASGTENRVGANDATVSGGSGNKASGNFSAIGGGLNNSCNSGAYATIPGGQNNTAAGEFSVAAGRNAAALHDGAFVWADSLGTSFASTSSNQFDIRATGGVGIGTPNPQGSLHVYSDNNPTVVRIQSTGTPGFGRLEFVSNPQGDAGEWRPGFIQSTDGGGFTGGLAFYVNGTGVGNRFATNEVMRIVNGRVGIGTNNPSALLQVGSATCTGTTWANASDRNAKENFKAVDTQEVLAKVAALPLSRWNYKEDKTSEHLGPMAQDFYAAFNVGPDDKHITTVDEGGVALAAIQGLNQKLEEQRAENALLKQRLEALEQFINQQK